MFYHYDTAGRLLLSAFAGTKKTTGWSGWPDDDDPGWFMHATRAVQENIYDPAGRVLSVANYWQEYNGTTGSGANQVPTYSTSKIADGKVAYEYSSTTGLRTNQKYYDVASGAWSLDRTEEYTYDSSLDYLSGVDYNDGLANEVQTWTYDAAGNRAGSNWVYDNLNRMTSAAIANGGAIYSSYTNDILGNRTHRNWGANSSSAMTYEWDVLNRAKVIAGVSAGGTYHYRADGQRVEKVTGTTITWVPDAPLSRSGHYDTNYVTNGPSSRYFYDGQMGFEDDYNPSGSVTKINRYALGARGIDRIENYESSTTTYGYPLYDGHGNMRAVLTKSGSSYATGNWRTYDVWGSVRSGSATGDPKQRYVASLGHVADDESGLTYMRARYYEPSTGRFVSEDPAKDGWNWYVYCGGDPINSADSSGRQYYKTVNKWLGPIVSLSAMLITAKLDPVVRMKTAADLAFLIVWFGCLRGVSGTGDIRVIGGLLMNAMVDIIAVALSWDEYAKTIAAASSPAMKVVLFCIEHVSFLSLFLSLEEIAEGS